MSSGAGNVKAWIGIVFIVWPIFRVALGAIGIPLPDIGPLPEVLALPSQAGGTFLLARSASLKKKKSLYDTTYPV